MNQKRMNQRDLLFDEAKAAINRLFSDTKRTPLETIDKLEELKDEIDSLVSSIDRNSGNSNYP